MRDWLRLVRAHNLLLAAAGVFAGGWIALGRLAGGRELWLAALSGLALGAAANAWNDRADVAADRANPAAAGRPLAAGRIGSRAATALAAAGALVGLGAAALVSALQLVAAGAACAVMGAYSPWIKRYGVPGNLAVAVVAGLPPWYGALAVGRPAAGLVPWVLGAWLHAVREIVKDVDDAAGDRAAGRRTLPLRLGSARAARVAALLAVLFVPVSVVLPLVGGWDWRYFALAAPAQLAAGVAAARLWRGAAAGTSRLLKVAMGVGLVALVVGRIA